MTPTSAKQTYLTAAGVSLAALILYIVTLAPTTQFWDASEYIAAAHALGIPHPPGNPFFVIVAHVWGLLPVASDYARRINFLAADERDVGGSLVSHRRAVAPAHRRPGRLAPPCRGRGRRGRRDDVHGVESSGGEREGLYHQRAVDRAHPVADAALGRSARRDAPRQPARPDRVSAGAHRHQSAHGIAGRTRGARLRAADRSARAAAAPVPDRRRPGGRRRAQRESVHSDPRAPRSLHESGRRLHVAGTALGAGARAIRQAVGVRQSDVPARSGKPGALHRADRPAIPQLLAVLHLAIRARLVGAGAAAARGPVPAPRHRRRAAPLASRSSLRARNDGAGADVDGGARVLSQLQMGLLAAVHRSRA